MGNEQKLIDLCFEMVLTATSHEWFENKSKEEIADWVATQLKYAGFVTKPIGASWGVLQKKED